MNNPDLQTWTWPNPKKLLTNKNINKRSNQINQIIKLNRTITRPNPIGLTKRSIPSIKSKKNCHLSFKVQILNFVMNKANFEIS